MKGKLFAVALVTALGGLQAGTAIAASFLEGRFYLDMNESKWGPGVNGAPAASGAPSGDGGHGVTGGIWNFDKDDGKHRQGWLMQTLKNGRLQFFYYDFDYDGKLHWLNDWYREAYEVLPDGTIRVIWEVHKDGMKEPLKGDPAICKINHDRSRLDCNAKGLHEVYSKTAAPPKVQ